MDFSNVNIYSLIAFILMLLIIAILSNQITKNKYKINEIIDINKKRLEENNEKISGNKLENGCNGYKFLNNLYSFIIFIFCILAIGFAVNIIMDLIHFDNRPEILQYFAINKMPHP
jgi:hypothetical protein